MKKKIMPLEVFFSITIIVPIVFIITIVCLEINIYSQKINIKSEASRIASNILENIKARGYDEFEKYIEEISYVGISKKIENDIQYIIISGNEFKETFFGIQIPKDYNIQLQIENNSEEFNILKTVTIFIDFFVNGKNETIQFSTIIERENIDECNRPIINDEYFSEFEFTDSEYNIIPIKYLDNKKSYITTNKNDLEWFNYSSKRWAKVVVFPKNQKLKELFVQEDGTLNEVINYNNSNIDLKDYIYVWIPNFSIKDDITYFRYGTGKKAIKMDFSYINGKYLYLNKIGEEIKDISEECNFEGIYGVWKKLGDEQDIYYSNFNLTKYGPINIY